MDFAAAATLTGDHKVIMVEAERRLSVFFKKK